MSQPRFSFETGLEFVGDEVASKSLTDEELKNFRPAAHVGASEIELGTLHRKYPKRVKGIAPILVSHTLKLSHSKKDVSPRSAVKMFSRGSPTSAHNLLPAPAPGDSEDLLTATEYKMELLNMLREREYYAARKHEEIMKRKIEAPYIPDAIEFMPEQIQKMAHDYEINQTYGKPPKRYFKDNADYSCHPSYTKFEIPYQLKCWNRYQSMRLKYEMQFRYELEMLQCMQISAYETARFAT